MALAFIPSGAYIAEEDVQVYHSVNGALKPGKVLYPYCSGDVTPSIVFPNVTYVDNRTEITEMLRQAGQTAICADMRQYDLNIHFDLVIVKWAAACDQGRALQHVARGGHLLHGPSHFGGLSDAPPHARVEFTLVMRKDIHTNRGLWGVYRRK